MTTSLSWSFSSLEEYIRDILNANGFSELDEANQEKLLNEFMDQALMRIVAGLSPYLSEAGKERFDILLQDQTTSDDAWQIFWEEEVPDYTQYVEKILKDYAVEIKQALAQKN